MEDPFIFHVKNPALLCTNQTNPSQIPMTSSNDVVFQIGNDLYISFLDYVLLYFIDLWMCMMIYEWLSPVLFF